MRPYLQTKLLWIGADLAVAHARLRRALPGTEILAESALQGGLARLRSGDFDAAVLSLAALDCGIATGPCMKSSAAPLVFPSLFITGKASWDDVISLTRRGVFHVLLGEVDPDALAEAAARAFRHCQGRRARVEAAPWRRFLIGQSHSILQICEIVQLVAAKRCTILISGETGTGKEVIAKAIHAAGNRAANPMISVNCTALPTGLIETELFGHTKGAFTGAHSRRIGRFEQAHRGSIFLDEIGDLPLEAQAKLLRVLQEQEFQRVGSSETVHVDVRVIAASNFDLEQAVRERRFREDLYYRLNVVPLHVSPLRERREDIPLLIQYFLEKIRAAENASPKQIAPGSDPVSSADGMAGQRTAARACGANGSCFKRGAIPALSERFCDSPPLAPGDTRWFLPPSSMQPRHFLRRYNCPRTGLISMQWSEPLSFRCWSRL